MRIVKGDGNMDNRTCKVCNQTMPVSHFPPDRKRYDCKGMLILYTCKKCKAAKQREKRKENSDKIMAIKKTLKCSRCNCDDYRCLQFHHINPGDKEFNIGHLTHAYNWQRIQKEIDKTVPICGNCHLILHHEERNGSNV